MHKHAGSYTNYEKHILIKKYSVIQLYVLNTEQALQVIPQTNENIKQKRKQLSCQNE